jgi:rhamnosyl/mannosyltransferase
LRAVLRRSKAIVVSSKHYLDTSSVLHEYRDRCRVVPFGISEQYFARPDERAVGDIRSQYGERLVLSVGRLVDYKGFEYLIQAMAGAPGRLLIAGEGPLKGELVALARSLGIADRVIFLGEPSDELLRNLYHATDVFALASTNRSEAFGLVQAEAMAASKPVINTNVDSGVPFVSLDHVTGLTVPHSDVGSLAGAITRLMEDAPLRSMLGRAARRRAEAMFQSGTMAAGTLRVYQSVLRAGRFQVDEELLSAVKGKRMDSLSSAPRTNSTSQPKEELSAKDRRLA